MCWGDAFNKITIPRGGLGWGWIHWDNRYVDSFVTEVDQEFVADVCVISVTFLTYIVFPLLVSIEATGVAMSSPSESMKSILCTEESLLMEI